MGCKPHFGNGFDWRHVEGVVDAGYFFGPDRYAPGSRPVAPVAGVKVRPGNPSQNQIAIAAASFGYISTDRVFTVWKDTLRVTPSDKSSALIIPDENDRIRVALVTWVIKSIKEGVYDTQYIFYCQKHKSTNPGY